jgi:hypothetical protein
VTRHNFLQKRARLLKQIRDAHVSLLWHLNDAHPQGKRARTLAARKGMELSRDLWKLLSSNEPQEGSR